MRTLLIVFLFPLFTIAKENKSCALPSIKTGKWRGELMLSDSDVLPFELQIDKEKGSYIFTIINGDERITLNKPVYKNDSAFIRFPFFNSELVLTSITKRAFSGEWRNYNKGDNYRLPLTASYSDDERFKVNHDQTAFDANGKWQIEFEPGTNSAYPALGVFNSVENKLNGTFLTQTGDYRFLAGNISHDSLFLSCFDGSHAFLFKAELRNDSLYGRFYSGNHWQSEWVGFRNDNFELTDPESLTYMVKDTSFHFRFKDLSGNDYIFPNNDLQGKVVIVQIMGSWCPNCLDETQYFKDLYNRYHQDGLEIISIGYEIGKTHEAQVESIEKLKQKLGLDFIFLVGGRADKSLVSSQFSMLNEVISFPTTIFISRDGTVKRVHTGFNGPGTGVYYTEYIQRTNSLIETMLAE